MTTELQKTDIKNEVIQLIRDQNQAGLSGYIDNLSSKDIIHLIGHMKRTDQMDLLNLLSPEDAADVMEDIPDAQAIGIIEEMEASDAAAIINEMESDDQVDLIMELEQDDANAILTKMDPVEAESVMKLMTYDPDVAGGVMHTEYFSFFEDQTVRSVTKDLRANADDYKDFPLKYIYVKDSDDVLKGVLQIPDLLLAPMEAPISNIKIKNVTSVDHLDPLDELIDVFQKHELYGVPVTDQDHKLVGVVLRRDILEAQNKRIVQEHLDSQGIVGGDELRTMPILQRARRRLSWLSVNIILNIIAASVIAFHQDTLTSVIALAVFLPIISDMSGCTGNQAVAVSMRELSIGVITPKEIMRVWGQEITVGMINGSILGLLIGLAAYLWQGNIYLGLVVGGALAVNTLLAVSIGGTVPLILKGFDIDPALASGPILTTITDMVGFFLTLTFAALALAQLSGM